MLFSKKFIIGHILIVIIATTCFFLSNWQFDRLAARRALNKRIISRQFLPKIKLTSLMPSAAPLDVDRDEYRQVTVTGKYNLAGQILISGRARDEAAGYNVVTPFVISHSGVSSTENDEPVVYIDRGWIPQTMGDALKDGSVTSSIIAPAKGYDAQREVVGIIHRNEPKELFSTGKQVSKNDLESILISSKLFQNVSGVKKPDLLYKLWIEQRYEIVDGKKFSNKTDSLTNYPSILPPPTLTEDDHFSYAIQWIIFGCIALVTWGIVCKKTLEKKRRTAVA